MAAVLSMVKHASKDTVEALEHMLVLARRGELRGAAVYYQDIDGYEDAIFTGLYRRSVAEALKAATLMSRHLTSSKQ